MSLCLCADVYLGQEWDNRLKYFAELRDPLVEWMREHLLGKSLLITIAAILSGDSGWNEVEDYAPSKMAWFKSFFLLPGGIPSYHTFNRVFFSTRSGRVGEVLRGLVSSIAKLTAGEVVSIDGKALCGMRENGKKTHLFDSILSTETR